MPRQSHRSPVDEIQELQRGGVKLKRMEACNGNVDCVPPTDARCDVEVVQQVPERPVVPVERPVVPAARYFLKFDVEFSNLHPNLITF